MLKPRFTIPCLHFNIFITFPHRRTLQRVCIIFSKTMKSILNCLIGSSFLSLSTWKPLHSLQEHIRKFSSSYENNLRQEKTAQRTGPKIKWQQRGRKGTRIEPFSLQPLGHSPTGWVSRCGPSPSRHISEPCACRKATCVPWVRGSQPQGSALHGCSTSSAHRTR